MNKLVMIKLILSLLFIFPVASAHAYFATLDNGNVLGQGEARIIASPQFILTEHDGVNAVGRFDYPIGEDGMAVRGQFGFGTVDFHTAGYFKWVPYPDIEGQPAIGLLAGLSLGRIDGKNYFGLRVHPLISKKFSFDGGDITPYGSIPIGLNTTSGDSTVPVQLVGGAELFLEDLDAVNFWAEVGLNVTKAFSYISLGASFTFDLD